MRDSLHRLAFAALLALLTTLLLGAFPSSAIAQTTHIVAQGHTLGKIARRYNISVEALREANGIKVGERLHLGQRLTIPASAARPAAEAPALRQPAKSAPAEKANRAPAPETTHLVAAGHTLGRIAQRYHASVDALREANGLARGAPLRPGTCLAIPLPPDARPVPPQNRPCSLRDGANSTKPNSKSYTGRPARPGIIRLVHGSISWSGRLTDRRGRPIPDAREHLDRILLSDATGETHPSDLRLMPLLTRISDHFAGRTIHVVSGYRPPMTNRYSAHSHHNNGEALDFYVEGVPNDVLRDFCHSFSKVGVGYYPRSTFLHLDVRSVTTHWVDESGPGEAPVYSSVSAPDAAPSLPTPASPLTHPSPSPTHDPDSAPDTE